MQRARTGQMLSIWVRQGQVRHGLSRINVAPPVSPHNAYLRETICAGPAMPGAKEAAMRLTTRTNLALRTLMFCAVNKDSLVRKHDVARAVNASENHLAQVINKLRQEGFIVTQRGRHGGFHLARGAASISVGAVFRAFESSLPFIECFSASNTCPLKAHCVMRPHLSRAVEAFYSTLDEVCLSELVDCNAGLQAILNMDVPRLSAPCHARSTPPPRLENLA